MKQFLKNLFSLFCQKIHQNPGLSFAYEFYDVAGLLETDCTDTYGGGCYTFVPFTAGYPFNTGYTLVPFYGG